MPTNGSVDLNQPIVGMASTPDGQGYWLVASDGRVFTFGDAGLYGSTGGSHMATAIALIVTPDGRGYSVIDTSGLPTPFRQRLMFLPTH
jgi:hypothetical protein